MELVHKDFTIHAMLYSECRTGDVWIYEKFKSRLIRINNPENNKTIVVSYRKIDERFEKIYNLIGSKRRFINSNKNSLVIDEYYRNKLVNVNLNENCKLKISEVCKFDIYGYLQYLNQHPSDIVRISYRLAIVSIIISFKDEIKGIFKLLHI